MFHHSAISPAKGMEADTIGKGKGRTRGRFGVHPLADISHPARNADRPERRLSAGLSRSPATRGANRPAPFLLAALSRLEAGAPDSYILTVPLEMRPNG